MRERELYIEEHTTEHLENELERTLMAIACCAWETDWTKDLREYAKRVETELESRHAALDPEQIAFEEAERNGY